MSERKVQLSVTVDPELVEWLDAQVKNKVFANRSHGIELALFKLKEKNAEKY